MTQITEAYNKSSSIPIDELSFTFGILLTLQLEQTTNIMEAWLLQFQAGQKCQANKLKPECHNQGKITKFLISCTCGCHPEKPPDRENSSYLPHLHFNLSPIAQVQPSKPSRPALLQRTLNFKVHHNSASLDSLFGCT